MAAGVKHHAGRLVQADDADVVIILYVLKGLYGGSLQISCCHARHELPKGHLCDAVVCPFSTVPKLGKHSVRNSIGRQKARD